MRSLPVEFGQSPLFVGIDNVMVSDPGGKLRTHHNAFRSTASQVPDDCRLSIPLPSKLS